MELVRTMGSPREGFYPITSIAFHPDGRRALAVDVDDTTTLWDVDQGGVLGSWQKDSGLRFSPDGSLIAFTVGGGTVRLRHTDKGGVHAKWKAHDGEIRSVVFSPDAKGVLSLGADETARLCSLDGSESRSWQVGDAAAVSFIGDGEQAATAWIGVVDEDQGEDSWRKTGGGMEVRVWDLASGEQVGSWEREGDWSALSFGPDGTRMAVRSATMEGGYSGPDPEDSLDLFEVQTGEEIVSLHGAAKGIYRSTFTPDGRVLFSDLDRRLSLWDLDPDSEPLSITVEGLYAVCASRDRILIGKEDGTLALYRLP